MADARPLSAPQPKGATGVVVFADGRVVWGKGFGAEGEAVGELCFNTAMTGYQEVMTDPSYAKQVISFTFPHIGNVGANDEDVEAAEAHALGCLVREVVTEVLQKMIKQRRESADLYRKGNRAELADAEEAEIAVIERFLPKQMTDEEASAAIQAIIAETGASGMKDMGKVMGEVKSRLAGQIDPARASAMVRAALA